jgi:hypothetical protein
MHPRNKVSVSGPARYSWWNSSSQIQTDRKDSQSFIGSKGTLSPGLLAETYPLGLARGYASPSLASIFARPRLALWNSHAVTSMRS